MKSAATGTASGCVVWVLTFCVLSTCVLSAVVPLVGAVTSTNEAFVESTIGPYLCPQGSTAELTTYETTGVDSSGNPISTTAYEMQCVDANGNITREPSVDYAFMWIGILAVIGLVVSALAAFLLAAPAGVVVAGVMGRLRRGRVG